MATSREETSGPRKEWKRSKMPDGWGHGLKWGIVASLALVVGSPVTAWAQASEPRPATGLRAYSVHRVAEPIVIDGDLGDTGWTRVPWTSDFVHIEGAGRASPPYRTRAKLLWNDDFLYLSAELEEPDVWGTLTRRDAIIYQDDDFEIFLDPDGDGLDYFELEINALGTVFDLFLPRPYREGGRADLGWDVEGLESAVRVDGTVNDPSDVDRGWSVEIAVPWEALVPDPPRPGDEWRANFSRVDWHLEVREGRYEKILTCEDAKPVDEENWVWSPQGAVNMHLPERWGVLRFVGASGSNGGAGTESDGGADPGVSLDPVRGEVRER